MMNNKKKNVSENLFEYQLNSNFTIQAEKNVEMKKAPVIDENKLGGNPYLYTLQIPVTKIITSKEKVETAEGVWVDKTFYKEKTPKVEIYIHEAARSNVAGISDKAQRLYLHILYSLKRNQEWIYLNKEFYMRENKVASLTTFYDAIKELQRYEYIQKTVTKEVYWINPHRFFPGNRVVKYPDKIKSTIWDRTTNIDIEEQVKPKKKQPFKFNKDEA